MSDEGLAPNYFDKVLLVGEIARLQQLHDHEKGAKEHAVRQVHEMAALLKAQSQKTFAAMNIPLDKISTLVQSLRPWLLPQGQEAFDQLRGDPDFEAAIANGIRALFVETMG